MTARSKRWRRQKEAAKYAAIPRPLPIGAPTELSLPSVDDRLRFTVTVFVEAQWGGVCPAPPALLDIARHGVARRADDVARHHPLTAQERLRCELNANLHRWDRVPEAEVMARGHCLSINTDAELVAAVAAREEATRRQLVGSWVEEQRVRRTEQMSTLLLDPLRATAAWFLENQDKPEQVVETANEFKKLQEVLSPKKGPDSAGALLDELLRTIDEPGRLRTLTILKNVLVRNERHDLAAGVVFANGDAAQS
ncbi:hypothetical protein [Amycolatopsis sp. w19]|uniref:hypothetical protein n=1 Tax=Amycolatopsis sp. w19 TaxID=3448134 RepID=UPI003F1D69D5